VDSLNCPTLLLRGAQSDFLPRAVALEMAVRNSRVELLEIANATHYVHDDNFVAFSEALNSFLRRD
jgi:pimeloyl-ACP methyl ester carboxylesterase